MLLFQHHCRDTVLELHEPEPEEENKISALMKNNEHLRNSNAELLPVRVGDALFVQAIQYMNHMITYTPVF